MAKKTPQNTEGLVQDFDLPFDEAMALEFLRRSYHTRQNFVNSKKLKKYRGFDLGEIDVESLISIKQYFDPKDVAINEGGNAEYMRTDWRLCPLIQSLLNIIKQQIKSNISSLSVKGSDKISVDKKAKEKLRILNKRNMVDNINNILSITGKPPISYDANLDKIFTPKKGEQQTEDTQGLLDQIKSEAQDDWDYSLLAESGMLKDGVEIAHEEMIAYYMSHSKFDDNVAEQIISDWMKVQAQCYLFYTSKMDGTPQVQYISPDKIFVSQFFNKDSSDKDFCGYNITVTWSDYMQMIGGKLTIEQNKEVYEANRTAWYSLSPSFDQCMQVDSGFLNTKINLGYIEVKRHEHDKEDDCYYDVTKKFYYLPLASDMLKAKFILDLGNLQDMKRSGDRMQYCDYSIIMRRDNSKMSFYDIMEEPFNMINKIYNQIKNTFASFIPEGIIFAQEPLQELANDIISEMQDNGMVEDANASSKIQAKIIRRIRQSGSMIAKKRKGDNDEERLDNPTSVMENKILIDLAGLFQQLMTYYNMMLMSLGINPNRLAQEPKPRTTNKSIQGATGQSAFATMDIERAYEFAMTEFGERMLYYDQQVISEFNDKLEPTTDRSKIMKSILGTKGINWLEVYQDMPEQRCILEVIDSPTEQDRMILLNYVTQLEMNGQIPVGTLVQLQGIDNFKLAKLFVAAQIKRQQRQAVENQQAMMAQQAQQQQAMAQGQAQQQQALMQQQAKTQEQLTALDNQLKTQGQLQVKDKTNENRKDEATHQAELDMAKEQQISLI